MKNRTNKGIKFIKISNNLNCDLPNQQKFPIKFIFGEAITSFSAPLLWIDGNTIN